jgi:formylmethanofuran dehydrogenase subunit B
VSRRGRSIAAEPIAAVDGAATGIDVALDRAANLLAAARRVLVTGLADATLEGVQAACELAESLGAAIDAGAADAASPIGPLVSRAGSITTDFEELRDRADLVLCWFCDPDALQPGFTTGFLASPLAGGGPRRVIAVGPEPVAGGRHVQLPAEAAVDATRLLEAILLGHDVPPENATAAVLTAACRELATAIHESACLGFVTARAADPLGLTAWAVNRLVYSVNHRKPAFVVPLAASPAGALGNATGAAAVLTWRYGAAGAIAQADRDGGDFRPGECSGAALVATGEVDAVLAVGRLAPEIEEAIAARAADLAVIRIDDRAGEPPGCAGPCVHLRASPPAGTMLRADGREVSVGDPGALSERSLARLLTAIQGRLAPGAAS